MEISKNIAGLVTSILLLIIVAGVWGTMWDPHVGDGLYDYGLNLVNANSIRTVWGGGLADIGTRIWAITPLLVGMTLFGSTLFFAYKTLKTH